MRFKGWKHIFAFTYIQQVKSKGFIASTAIVCVLIIAIVTLIGVFSFSGTNEPEPEMSGVVFGDEASSAEKFGTLYICNETKIPSFDASDINMNCVNIDKSELESIQETVKTSDKAELLLHAVYENGTDGNVRLKFYCPMNKDVLSEGYIENIMSSCKSLFKASLLTSIGINETDIALADTVFQTDLSTYGAEISETKQAINTLVTMLLAVIMFIFIISYAQIIAQSVAMEKTSRVIELLITSVRPLAIVMGKVFAMLLVVLTQILIIGVVAGIAIGVLVLIAVNSIGAELISMGINAAQSAGEAAQAIDMSWVNELVQAVPGLFNPLSIIFIVIIFLLGFLFYSLLAALIGAGISRSEDLATGMQPLSLISVLGFFLAYFPSCFNMGYIEGGGEVAAEPSFVMLLSYYLPISSPFALPSAIILGQIGTAQMVIATLILALLTVATMMLVAKVYENVILYSGSPLKLGQIIKMAKNK